VLLRLMLLQFCDNPLLFGTQFFRDVVSELSSSPQICATLTQILLIPLVLFTLFTSIRHEMSSSLSFGYLAR
jgi:hypothetical protein